MVKTISTKMRKKSSTKEAQDGTKKQELTASLQKNIKLIQQIFLNDETVRLRQFENQENSNIKCGIFYTVGMSDDQLIIDSIIQPVMNVSLGSDIDLVKLPDILQNKVIINNYITKTADVDELVGSIIAGDTVLLAEGASEALIIASASMETRAVDEPDSEKVVKGPRDGFVEVLNVNISLLKRRINTPDLKFKFRELGTKTKTKMCICYLQGIANEKILKELEKRLDKVNMDGILEAGYLEELIKDSPLSPFETTFSTERPDIVAGKLLEGRIAVLCDGTSFVITVPFIFMEYMQVNEDYYQNYIYGSFNRLLRWAALFLSTSVPAVYTALITFNQEMIPTALLLSVSSAREGVPFPTIFEAVAMLLVFEILREAGIRLPTAIGQTISIVGALVLGEAAVTARIISAPMIIVVAITGLSSFVNPKMLGPQIVVRFVFLGLSAFLGMYGYIFGIVGLFIHLMSIRSFGIPYMINIASVSKQEIKDVAIRAPWWYMSHRPSFLAGKDPVRRPEAKPQSPKSDK